MIQQWTTNQGTTMRQRLGPFAAVTAVTLFVSIYCSCHAAEIECQADGTCQDSTSTTEIAECGLFLAESSIPNAGWGVYTGQDLQKGDNLDIFEAVIPYIDHWEQVKLQKKIKNVTVPRILLTEYFWASTDTNNYFDAGHVESIFPGFGMLPNCHAGLINLEQLACADHHDAPRTSPTAGASSHFHDCQFAARRNIPAGHELFDQYGDDWFEGRSKIFGDDLPLSGDFKRANALVRLWQSRVGSGSNASPSSNGNLLGKILPDNDNKLQLKGEKLASDLWKLIAENPLLSPRTQSAMPEEAPNTNDKMNVAYDTVPNAIRSLEWLQRNGMCLDNLVVRPIDRYQERGAFARRAMKQGSVVAPAPVVHLSRKHVEYLYAEEGDQGILWEGKQLLLNYCYGHPDSSLLLLPDAPMVNLINHYNASLGQKPNVAVRWSTRSNNKNAEWFQLTPDELTGKHNTHSLLMMEFYAMTDIGQGDELLLDYGDSWQKAWDEHGEQWNRLVEDDAIVHADDYVSAFDYAKECDLAIATQGKHDCLYKPPSWIQTRCFLKPFDKVPESTGQWMDWEPPETNNKGEDGNYSGMHDQSNECDILDYDVSGSYRVHFYPKSGKRDGSVVLKIENVPKSAIIFVDRMYTGNQYLRYAFRHEIQLPDELVPAAWRDLAPEPDSSCGLYMAESAIPNSGLGMYTAEAISEGERISYGGLVVQADDVDLNVKLRRWFETDFSFAEDRWLLHMYYWDPSVSMGGFEADDVQSIIPGLGMLANSHTGLMNADIKAPTRLTNLQRGRDPGAGASTTFHDGHFDAMSNIEAGAELFVIYGDEWFADRAELGDIPLSDDFELTDKSLRKFDSLFGDKEELIVDALEMLLRSFTAWRPRLLNAIPRTYADYKTALRKGSASLTVPNRVRSVEWLRENGRCLDNIRPDISTIRQAGRGAFATRRIKKGDIIAPMPVVHLRRRHMEIYDGDDFKDRNAAIWRDGTQLLLNYCFSHPESSLLLFPYSPVVQYVNHHLTGFNADLRWSDLPNHHSEWLERTPDDLDHKDHAGLIMEMVATRDIEAGEEVFINYGPEWQAAWDKHVEQWKPFPDKKGRPASAAELNARIEWLKTESEREDDPEAIPNDDVFTVCFVAGLTRAQRLKREGDLITYEWKDASNLFATEEFAYPCDVLERMDQDNETTTTLDVDHAFDRKDSLLPVNTIRYQVRIEMEDVKQAIVEGVPRRAIQLFDREYKSESFSRDAFRHEMRLPNSMVSDAWRDLERLDRIRKRLQEKKQKQKTQ